MDWRCCTPLWLLWVSVDMSLSQQGPVYSCFGLSTPFRAFKVQRYSGTKIYNSKPGLSQKRSVGSHPSIQGLFPKSLFFLSVLFPGSCQTFQEGCSGWPVSSVSELQPCFSHTRRSGALLSFLVSPELS